jgi:hypothetical protein
MTRPYQFVRVSLLAGALLVPGFAQSADPNPQSSPSSPGATSSGSPSSPTATSPGTMPGTTNRTDDRDHDFNMGWLGLVGLAGLLGLRRHDHRNEARSIDNTGPGGIR